MVLVPRKNAGLNFYLIGRTISELLYLPYGKRDGKAFNIAKAVIQVVKEALQRGERVRIAGLGVFSIRTNRAYYKRSPLVWGVNGKRLKRPKSAVFFIPERRHVHFRLANDIRRGLIEKEKEEENHVKP